MRSNECQNAVNRAAAKLRQAVTGCPAPVQLTPTHAAPLQSVAICTQYQYIHSRQTDRHRASINTPIVIIVNL